MYVRVRMLGVCVCVGVRVPVCTHVCLFFYVRVYPCVYKFNTIVVSLTLRLCISASINRGHSDQHPGMR